MPLAANLQRQDYQYKFQVLQGIWRWTTRLNVLPSGPVYEVRDILSPFGLLRDGVPIPGDVVAAMAESIDELKSAFAPSILVSPTTLTFDLDEGRGFGEAQTIQVTNSGVYGSVLTPKLTTTAPYVKMSPTNLGALSFNESGLAQIMADSTALLAADSPYGAAVTLQDPTATNNPQVVVLIVNVRPKAMIVLTPVALTFVAVRPLTGPYPPVPTQTFDLSNTGLPGSVLDYQIQKLINNSPWLVGVNPPMGTLGGGATQAIQVIVQPTTDMMQGTYTETLRVSGYSSNYYQDLTVTLTIS